jgi:hypothetical protein
VLLFVYFHRFNFVGEDVTKLQLKLVLLGESYAFGIIICLCDFFLLDALIDAFVFVLLFFFFFFCCC